jgi:hypothetical protein
LSRYTSDKPPALPEVVDFFDNATESPRLIFKEEAGKTTIEDAALYEYLRGQFEV